MQARTFFRRPRRTKMKLNRTQRLLGGLLAAGLLLAASSQAQATPLQWFLVNWVFEDGNTASGSFVFDVDVPRGDPNRWTNINITSEIGPTIFDFEGIGAESEQLAFVTGNRNTEDLTGTFALLGELPNNGGMTNAGGTIGLVLDDGMGGMNFNSSQTVCSDATCGTSMNPIYLVSGSITTNPVPEPGTALLLGLGLTGLGVVGRRRREGSERTA